jgi:hypothetical protein
MEALRRVGCDWLCMSVGVPAFLTLDNAAWSGSVQQFHAHGRRCWRFATTGEQGGRA